MSNYDNLHRQCRTLENQFDVKLASYSQLVSSISRSKPDLEASGSLERWQDLETELEELLAKARIRPLVTNTFDTHSYGSWKRLMSISQGSLLILNYCRLLCCVPFRDIGKSVRTMRVSYGEPR